MKKLTARRLGIVAGLVILIGAFAVFRFLSEMKEPPKRKEAFSRSAEVEVIQVRNGSIPTRLNVQGELAAYDKISIYAEVSGVLEESSRPFKVGSYFPEGSVLARIDSDEARLSLLSQRSNFLNAVTQLMPDLKIDYPESYHNWEAYVDSFDLEEETRPFPDPLSQQEKFFVASRNLYSQYYTIKSTEERLSKYVIRAPFSGVLTDALIHPGALVRVGQQLGELTSTGSYELEATVPLSELKYIKTGDEVKLVSDDIDGDWTGRIARINSRVDQDMQTVRIFVNVRGRDLREGMYLKGDIAASSVDSAAKIPRNVLADQKSVFEVRDSTLHKREVNVLKITKDHAIIRGLEDGTLLLKNVLPNAFEGMNVKVKNTAAVSEPPAQTASTPGG